MFKKSLLVIGCLLLMAGLGINLVAAQEATRVGETVLIEGHVLDVNGNPVVGAVVEIWQTDARGVYNHPDDAAESELDPEFQYFGTSTTDEAGSYSFRTVKPAWYEAARPPHIHVKVKIEEQTVLTTQFYFDEDRELFQNDSVFNAGEGDLSTLILLPEDTTDENDNLVRLAQVDLIVATAEAGTSGTLPLTPAQAEGPYYPVVDFSTYDNDLTSLVPEFTLLNLNTASSDDFLTIPDMGNRMVREFEEYRPYISIEQFRREIGKYVDENQVAAYEAYVFVPVDVNESDAATLQQIPGVDEATANALIAARPYDSNEAFLTALNDYLSPAEVEYAAHYLVTE